MCETGLTLSEISYMLKHTRSFAREKTGSTRPWPSSTPEALRSLLPTASVLIMSPWNYPFLLTIEPLVDAIAAGNTAVLKPSAYSPATSARHQSSIIERLLPAGICHRRHRRPVRKHLPFKGTLRLYLFHRKPGGRKGGHAPGCGASDAGHAGAGRKKPLSSWTVTANLKLAASRIVFGKFLNCGQTCVAPDYIYCDPAIKDQLVEEIKKEIRRQFTGDPLSVSDLWKNHQRKAFSANPETHGSRQDRLWRLTPCRKSLKIAPTVMDNVTFSDPVMQEEIFGPVLPVLTWDSLEGAVAKINSMAHPLALYLFTSDKKTARFVTSHCGFGGGCINDTIIHLATSEMGFGGFGESGMGSYHGKAGFLTFSHTKSIVDKKTWLDLPMRYQPYRKLNDKLIHIFLR